MSTYTEIAKMIDHSVLHPTLTDEDLKTECETAITYNVASVCVKPYAVKLAAKLVHGTDVKNGCVIGFPHGNSAVSVKAFETEQAINDGAQEIDMVVNIGKVLQEDWKYVENEIGTIVNITKKHNAVLKVIFENDFLPEDSYKIRLCEICNTLKVDFVKTSTGFGFVKGSDGKYSYNGATEHDVALMRKHSNSDIQVKAAGAVRNLNDLLTMKNAGAKRCGATATKKILDEAKEHFGE